MILDALPDVLKKAFVAVLLLACVGICALEMSGRWDRTLADTNDEAGVVAVVLCVGAGLAVARALLRAIRLSRTPLRLFIAAPPAIARPTLASSLELSFSFASPPLALRI